MKSYAWNIEAVDQLDLIVTQLIELKSDCAVFTFSGPLGVGKTMLCQKFLRACGIQEPVVSPTFAYLNTYKNDKNEIYYHFDLYRLSKIDGFLQAGFDEYLYRNNSWALVEWPELVKPLLTHNVCFVTMDYALNASSRFIQAEVVKSTQ